MKKVFIISGNIISSLGFTIAENMKNIVEGRSGVKLIDDKKLFSEDFYASLVDSDILDENFSKLAECSDYTRFEKLCIISISDSLKTSGIDIRSPKTLIVFSTTKGNIDLLEADKKTLFDHDRVHLWKAADIIKDFFGNPNKPIVVSNACISGVLAIIAAHDILQDQEFENVLVIGCDVVSEFIVSGFQSFKSLTNGVCKPFDVNRDGLNLGEGCGTIILTTDPKLSGENLILVRGGATSNDANHISGPSRTGEGLFYAVKRAIEFARLSPSEIDFISAHGTATTFNDEMESKAFSLAELNGAPVNSLKAYFGHTLGAAGVIESLVSIEAMKQNLLIKTLGYKEYGVPEKITIIAENQHKEQKNILKTASGFGGCNAAVIFSKNK
jgi:3-oxoacyl-[acyl-carrier-protein] synthase-1